MNDILIKNGHIITMNPEREIIKKGDIRLAGDEIAEVGKDLGNSSDEIIEAGGKAVLPGLINAHTHLSMTLFRGIADDLNLQTWLQEKIWPLEQNLEARHVYDGALLGCLEMIKSGTTCFADQYFFMDEVARAVEDSGLRANLSYGIIEEGDEEKRRKELEVGENLVKNYENTAEGRIKTMFGPHSTYTCSPECLKEVRELADKHEVGIHIHLSENEKEIETVKEMHGKRPPELLDSIGFLDSDVLAAHCTQINDNEIRLLRENEVKPVHNPVSNMKLGSGIAPVPELLSEETPVALGTDGAASNNSLDIFEEIKFAALLHKLNKKDPTVIPARKALEMATINGAKALGLDEKIGSLEEGKKADLILIDLNKPHLTPPHNIESHLVYSGGGSDVDTVIINGTLIMEKREVLTLEENEVMENCQKSSEDLTRKVS